jgi:hypothetical protein
MRICPGWRDKDMTVVKNITDEMVHIMVCTDTAHLGNILRMKSTIWIRQYFLWRVGLGTVGDDSC